MIQVRKIKDSFVFLVFFPAYMKENMQIFDFELDADDLAKIEKLDRGIRCFGVEMCTNHKEFPFAEEY